MTRRSLAIILCLMLGLPGAHAQSPVRDDRIKILAYRPNQTWPIDTSVGETVFILLEHGEHIESVRMRNADLYQLTLTAEGDGLYLRQKREGASGVLRVDTGTRRYEFELHSATDTVAPYLMSFRADQPAPAPSPPPPVSVSPAPVQTGSYKLRGDKALWPRMMSDDGAKTYIRWADDQPLPAVFALEGPGGEETINAYMRSGVFTIDRVYERLIFRIDKAQATATRLSSKRKHRE